jgi:tRNA-Thr(GGU) m(6)t(6)A37 methyltransferase TsaA
MSMSSLRNATIRRPVGNGVKGGFMMTKATRPARWFRVQPIGFVRRPGAVNLDPETFYDPMVETALDILARWSDGLAGIEEYSHLYVIFWLDRARRTRKARAHVPEGRDGLPSVGMFATRTPRRPNPIGVAAPRLLRREGDTLWVTGIDAWPGTPTLDHNGYAPRDDLRPDATAPEWLETLWALHDAERGGNR